MSVTVFLAGATGVIGRRLCPLLQAAGYVVWGTTRDKAKARELKRHGIAAVVVDVFDDAAMHAGMRAARPDVVVQQLTDLPQERSRSCAPEALERNARIRTEGMRNLVAAAIACSAQRIISQSIAWAYAPGPEPHDESDPLDNENRSSIITLERLTLQSPPLIGTVLRFGLLYGPGTWYSEPSGAAPLHVDAAARATLLAIERSAAGVFNVVEERGYAKSERARNVLGWDAC